MSEPNANVLRFSDYYDLLDIDESASVDEVEEAYEQYVTTYHPDIADGDELSEKAQAELFTHLSQAREIFTDPLSRSEYDKLGHDEYMLKFHGTEVSQTEANPTSVDNDTTSSHAGDSASEASADGGAYGQEPGIDTGSLDEPDQWEGQADPTIEDFLESDPLETSWSSFRNQWRVRAIILLTAAAGLVISTQTFTSSGTAVASSILAAGLLTVITGGIAQYRLPRGEGDPPPETASVGYLRPSIAQSYRKRAAIALTPAAALTIAGSGSPHPWAAIRDGVRGSSIGEPFISTGSIGASKLVPILNAGLLVVLGLGIVIGLYYGVVGLSAQVWLDHHSGAASRYPMLWDGVIILTTVSIIAGFVLGAVPVGISSPVTPIPGSAIVNNQLTAITLGVCGLLVLILVEGTLRTVFN